MYACVRARARVLKFLMITGNENVCIINIYIYMYIQSFIKRETSRPTYNETGFPHPASKHKQI